MDLCRAVTGTRSCQKLKKRTRTGLLACTDQHYCRVTCEIKVRSVEVLNLGYWILNNTLNLRIWFTQVYSLNVAASGITVQKINTLHSFNCNFQPQYIRKKPSPFSYYTVSPPPYVSYLFSFSFSISPFPCPHCPHLPFILFLFLLHYLLLYACFSSFFHSFSSYISISFLCMLLFFLLPFLLFIHPHLLFCIFLLHFLYFYLCFLFIVLTCKVMCSVCEEG